MSTTTAIIVDSAEAENEAAAGDDPDAVEEPAGDEPTAGASGAADVDTGTVIVGEETFELTGPSRTDAILDPDLADPSGSDFDFEICETVNPAFAGDFNIAGTLPDGTAFRLSGNVDEELGESDGFFLGDSFDEERAERTDVSLDDRTLSGSATTSRGTIDFTFTC